MKILMLSDINSAHTQKWASALHKRGFEIGIFSIAASRGDWYTEKGIRAFIPVPKQDRIFSGSLIGKLGFLPLIPHLKRIVKSFRPDVVHAHYASSYGFLGAMCGFHPLVISAWGSDIYSFSSIPLIGRQLLQFNFRKAEIISSTSRAMLPSIGKYTKKEVSVISFGVDTDVFTRVGEKHGDDSGEIIIGTIKALEPEYGIEYLIRAFERVRKRHPEVQLKLLLIGGGSLEKELKLLANSLGLEQSVTFTGRVPYEQVQSYYHRMDIFAALSLSESFGVAVLEASSCGLPVVVSDVGGLPEVVIPGETGFMVPACDVIKSAEALEKLVLDRNLRREMGANGRRFTVKNYSLTASVERMLAVYRQLRPDIQ